jgi:hypothetical protein
MKLLVGCLVVIAVLFSPVVYAASVTGGTDTLTGPDQKESKRSVVFRLGRFEQTEALAATPFRDTVLMAFELLSKVFSSKAFKDSLTHYTFVCSNSRKKPCENIPQLEPRKCDSISGCIPGLTVYKDLTADSVINLSITLKDPVKKSGTIGFSNCCEYKITTYAWWVTSRKNVIESYAVHLAHEYAHVVGYVHNKKMHVKSEDVAYRIGGIVRHIIEQKEKTL